MAYNERKSLPPIIEDESDDMLHMLYRKELERSHPKVDGNGSHIDPKLTSHDNSPNSTQLPYISWKSKNAAYLKKSDSPSASPDMLSQLGQTLESCPMVLPQARHSPNSTRQCFTQEKGPLECQQVEMEAASGNQYSNFSEHGRYNLAMSSNPRTFDGQYRDRGYFPEQSSPFQGHLQRSFGKDLSSSNTFGFQHTPPPQLNASTNYRFPGSNPYEPQGYHINNEFDRVQSCHKECCKSTPHIQTTPVINRFNPVNMQIAHDNSRYHPDYTLKHGINSPQSQCHCQHNSSVTNKKREKFDKSIKKQIADLYRIVWLQNQQIMELQKQLKKRNDENDSRKSQDQEPPKIISKGSSEKRMFNLAVIGENQMKKENLMEKVSVGIMTSFIENTKVKSKSKRKEKKLGNSQKHLKSSSSSSSSAESSSQATSDEDFAADTTKKPSLRSRKPADESITLNGLGIQTVMEDHSPRSSPVHIEMQDYSSSNSDESSGSSECESENPTPVSWTFYDKVVGKVNNMLEKSDSDDSDNEYAIRNKTLEELRRRGINVADPDSQTLKRVTFDSNFHPKGVFQAESDTSMRINALAIKYLKEEKATTDAYETPEKIKKSKKKEKRKEEKTHHKKKSKSSQHSGKILDITAIKQQPKLLPKKP